MAITGIDHVLIEFPAGPEAEAVARGFYVGLLGMTEIAKPPSLAGRGGLWMTAGTAIIHLGALAGFVPAPRAHTALLVDDLDEMVVHLAAAGAELVSDVPLPGYKRIHTRDPFGNRLELMERVEP